MLEFILARGNYWLIIALMMTGLYITFAAQNLIKRLVGLSVFQTSVFLFYITLSKVAGGTAPILFGKDVAKYGYGDEAHGTDGGYGEEAVPAAVDAVTESNGSETPMPSEMAELPADTAPAPSLETLEGDDAVLMDSPAAEAIAETVDNVAGPPAATAYDLAEPALYNVYSNPLPHVLILTAIVVGVATLSVGLAIIVRIREAYGTIEADEVRHIDIDVALAEEAENVVPGGAA